MPSEQIQTQALNSIGMIAIGSVIVMGVWLVFMMPAPWNRSTKLQTVGAFGFWIFIVASLAWFAFDPAIRAMKFVSSPAMFIVIGAVSGVILFALRRVRKDIYGLLEVAVAIATLYALGRKYDTQTEITIIIGFVGAVYVIVRGLTNIAEHRPPSK